MTLRIVSEVREDGSTIRLIGHMRTEHVEHVRAELTVNRAPIAFDLDELRLADLDAILFLAAAERQGVILRHCAPFIREWMARETE